MLDCSGKANEFASEIIDSEVTLLKRLFQNHEDCQRWDGGKGIRIIMSREESVTALLSSSLKQATQTHSIYSNVYFSDSSSLLKLS